LALIQNICSIPFFEGKRREVLSALSFAEREEEEIHIVARSLNKLHILGEPPEYSLRKLFVAALLPK
jgi:hypothetical protein